MRNNKINKKCSASEAFIPLEKAADGAGSEYRGDDGGSKLPSSMTVKNRSSLTGFTLPEIMIVVSIIALLASITIPNLIYARLCANEAVAQGTLKTISQACESFRSGQVFPQYPWTLTVLTSATPPYIAGVVDTAVTGAPKNGYNFTYTFINSFSYVCCATPHVYRRTGIRTFAVNETGQVRALDNNGAEIFSEAAYMGMTVTQ